MNCLKISFFIVVVICGLHYGLGIPSGNGLADKRNKPTPAVGAAGGSGGGTAVGSSSAVNTEGGPAIATIAAGSIGAGGGASLDISSILGNINGEFGGGFGGGVGTGNASGSVTSVGIATAGHSNGSASVVRSSIFGQS